MTMNDKSFYLLSLGCAKNTVDSASISDILINDGYAQFDDPRHAKVLIVNTCGFIQPAREESISELKRLAKRKKNGQVLIATGCLPERHRQLIVDEVPGISGILGTRNWSNILNVITQASQHDATRYDLPLETSRRDTPSPHRYAIEGHYAYLKIADGCRRPCAFCSIPLIKGTAISRRMDEVLTEARQLSQKGIRELILIAQDTSDYGRDLGMVDGLSQLLEALGNLPERIPWVRVMYAYPGAISNRMIETMAKHSNIVHYLDMPLQHAHPDILKGMKRPANLDWVRKTIEEMRAAMPNLAIRTTFIVGYPGETETHFQTLLDFMSEIQFDRASAFPFFFEPGTASETYGDPIAPEVKQERLERLMAHQAEISLRQNQKWIGRTLDVLAEGKDGGITISRSFRDAPEIDGLVIVEGELPLGEITPVMITGALTHDLIAQPLN
ncbi:MAG: 30S ribosomal protein S12 methylthiotransferase RimO [Anaerolineae bacterium]|nr:30S ribosomal protein S12 methylthiotransferase RimO [Anaerolineae bacterium]